MLSHFFKPRLPPIQVEFLYNLKKIYVKIIIAFVTTRRIKLQYFLLVLHLFYNLCAMIQILIEISMNLLVSPRSMKLDLQRKKTRNKPLPPEQWYDVQDQDGIWRVGFCEKNDIKYKIVSLDGFHPSHTAYYCEHSGRIAPIRTHTKGLTVPQNKKTIRRIISTKQVESIIGKVSLFQLRSNQLQNTPQSIRTILRTELLITVDKIFNTPFQILATIKFIDIQINKFFITIIEYYLKILSNSKKFITALDQNETAVELYNATYEMSIIIEMILGVHKRSKSFYQSTINRTVTSQGFLQSFIKSEEGILPFKLFFKSLSGLKTIKDSDMSICTQAISLFVSMCQKYQKEFVDGSKYQSTTRIIVQEIINMVKVFCQKNQELRSKWKQKVEIISRIQTLYLKLFPDKKCTIRKIIEGDLELEKQSYRIKLLNQMQQEKKNKQQQKQNDKMKELQNKINGLEQTLNKLQTINLHGSNITVNKEKQEKQEQQPTENLGQQAFLGSLQWALDSGDINTCKKLISWRRSLLKLGRITGWQIALAVGMTTFKKKQILPEDIIEANYNFIKRSYKQK